MKLRHFLAIVELRTKVVSVSTLLTATFFALWSGARFDLPLFLLLFAASLAVDMGTTGFNTYFDFRKGVDESGRNRERDKVLVHEGVSPRAALAVAVGCFAAAVALGAVVAFLTSPWIAVAGAAGMLVGFLYTGGPAPLSRGPFGEVFAGGFLGSVFFLITYYVFMRSIDLRAFLVSLPQAVLIASILTVNNTCDAEGDRAAGRRTLSILLGPRGAELLIYAEAAAAFLLAGVLAFSGYLPPLSRALIGAAALASYFQYSGMHVRGFSHATKSPNMRAVARVLSFFALAIALGLAATFLSRHLSA